GLPELRQLAAERAGRRPLLHQRPPASFHRGQSLRVSRRSRGCPLLVGQRDVSVYRCLLPPDHPDFLLDSLNPSVDAVPNSPAILAARPERVSLESPASGSLAQHRLIDARFLPRNAGFRGFGRWLDSSLRVGDRRKFALRWLALGRLGR